MRWLLASLLSIAIAWSPAASEAGPFTSLAVFGDSLSDIGRAFAMSGGIYRPSPPYASGRFSNGPVAAEYLADLLGLPLLPGGVGGVPGGTDYAVGGATTGTRNVAWELDSPPGVQSIPALQHTGISTQVGEFLASNPTIDFGTALFMVWGGPNDIVLASALGGDLGLAAQAAVLNLVQAVQALALAGGRHFLVPNMIDLGQTPESIGTPFEGPLRLLVQAFNAGLAAGMAALEENLDGLGLSIDILVFDTFATFDQVVADPAAAGFTNVTEGCLDNLPTPVLSVPLCSGYFFVDFTHPTTAAHRLAGEAFFAAVAPTQVPAPASALLLVAAITGLAVRGRARRTRGASR